MERKRIQKRIPKEVFQPLRPLRMCQNSNLDWNALKSLQKAESDHVRNEIKIDWLLEGSYERVSPINLHVNIHGGEIYTYKVCAFCMSISRNRFHTFIDDEQGMGYLTAFSRPYCLYLTVSDYKRMSDNTWQWDLAISCHHCVHS